jgi:hypothetical protein
MNSHNITFIYVANNSSSYQSEGALHILEYFDTDLSFACLAILGILLAVSAWHKIIAKLHCSNFYFCAEIYIPDIMTNLFDVWQLDNSTDMNHMRLSLVIG